MSYKVAFQKWKNKNYRDLHIVIELYALVIVNF